MRGQEKDLVEKPNDRSALSRYEGIDFEITNPNGFAGSDMISLVGGSECPPNWGAPGERGVRQRKLKLTWS